MRKIFILCLAVFIGFSVCVADAAKHQKKESRFKTATQKQRNVVEEEQTNSGKKISKKMMFGCGEKRPVRVAGFVTNAPFGWVNIIPAQGGKPAQYENGGFAYDLFAQIVQEAGLKIQNVGYTSYQEAMRDLRQGKIDVLVGGYFDKRILGTGVNLMFPGYFTNPVIPVFLKGKEREVKSWDDLKGLNGVVRQEENIYPLIFNQLPKDIKIQQVSGSKKAFTMLLKGEVDFIVTSLYAAEAEVRRYKLAEDIYYSPKSLISPELFFIFASHSDCPVIKKRLKPILEKIKANKDEYMKTFISYIDEWGLRFKDKPGLKDELINAELQKAASDPTDEELASDSSDIESDYSDSVDDENASDADKTADRINFGATDHALNAVDKNDLESQAKNNANKLNSEEQKISEISGKGDSSNNTAPAGGPIQAPADESPVNRPLSAAERIKNL